MRTLDQQVRQMLGGAAFEREAAVSQRSTRESSDAFAQRIEAELARLRPAPVRTRTTPARSDRGPANLVALTESDPRNADFLRLWRAWERLPDRLRGALMRVAEELESAASAPGGAVGAAGNCGSGIHRIAAAG